MVLALGERPEQVEELALRGRIAVPPGGEVATVARDITACCSPPWRSLTTATADLR